MIHKQRSRLDVPRMALLCLVVSVVWSHAGAPAFQEALAAGALPRGNWGYIDRAGMLAIAPFCSWGREFKDGRTVAVFSRKEFSACAFVDRRGSILFGRTFTSAFPFEKGMAIVHIEKQMAFIDTEGQVSIEPGRFSWLSPFHEGLATASVGEGDDRRTGYIDRSARWVIQPKFTDGWLFSEGLAPVSVTQADGKKTGYINPQGGFVIEPRFQNGGCFHGGLACVSDGNRRGYINPRGEVVVPLQYLQATDFCEGLAAVSTEKGKWQYIDKAGDPVIRVNCHEAYSFHEGLALVTVLRDGNMKDGYIDRKGRFAVQPEFDLGQDFSEGLACVAVRQPDRSLLHGYIDATGKWVVQPRFLEGGAFSEGLAGVRFLKAEADRIRGSERIAGPDD